MLSWESSSLAPEFCELENETIAQIAQDMSASVLEACRADMVLFCFHSELGATTMIPAHMPDPRADLIAALKDLWEVRTSRSTDYGPGGLVQHVTDQGEMYFLLLLPLEAEGQNFGGLVIAISRENWIEQRAFAACSQITQLVAMNVVSVQTRKRPQPC